MKKVKNNSNENKNESWMRFRKRNTFVELATVFKKIRIYSIFKY